MHGGDKIYIAEPQASIVMVMGEVIRPSALEIPNGFMSLTQAIGM